MTSLRPAGTGAGGARGQKGNAMNLIDLGEALDEETRFVTFLEQICERLGVEYAAYAGTQSSQGELHGFVTYPESWTAHYRSLDLGRIDPTLIHARRSIAPVDWRRLPRTELSDRVFREARDFGISTNGLTVPVRGPFGDIGMLSVTSRIDDAEWDRLVRGIVKDLQSAAVHLHDTVMRLDPLGRALRQPQLSAREREVLQWIAAGKTYRDVGEILSISDRTVEVHLRSAREKLFALTTPQAVARAVSFGLIYPA